MNRRIRPARNRTGEQEPCESRPSSCTERAELVIAQYGYGRIDTPTFEETALFVRGVGEGTDLIEQET